MFIEQQIIILDWFLEDHDSCDTEDWSNDECLEALNVRNKINVIFGFDILRHFFFYN